MGVEEFFDVDLELDESGLDQLDRMASKAEKDLERIEKARKKAGGAIGGETTEGPALPKSTVREQEKSLLTRIQKLEKSGKIDLGGTGAPIQRKSVIQEITEEQDALKELMNSQLGTGKASQAMGMLSNPVGFLQNTLTRTIPIIGGIITATEIAKAVLVKMTERGGPFDRFFRDIIDNRVNALLDRQASQEIRAGFRQEILTTQSGAVSPRDSFNTYNQDEETQKKVEENYSIRTRAGLD